ncbi:MAG: hypothetical protein AAF581_13945 [Planctomycetota bacterium]
MNEETQKSGSSVVKILLIGCLVVGILGAVGIGGCFYWFSSNVGTMGAEQIPPIMTKLAPLVEEADDASDLKIQLEQVSTIAKEEKLSFWAFGALTNLDALADDGVLNDAEIATVRSLINVVVEKDGDVGVSELPQ